MNMINTSVHLLFLFLLLLNCFGKLLLFGSVYLLYADLVLHHSVHT